FACENISFTETQRCIIKRQLVGEEGRFIYGRANFRDGDLLSLSLLLDYLANPCLLYKTF
ncbi:MAG: hypothetical protein WBN66_09655, partial [Smithella sp.]